MKYEVGKEKNYTQPKGMKITWFGNTPQTSSQSNCGAEAVQNLLGGRISLIKNCAVNGYQRLINML